MYIIYLPVARIGPADFKVPFVGARHNIVVILSVCFTKPITKGTHCVAKRPGNAILSNNVSSARFEWNSGSVFGRTVASADDTEAIWRLYNIICFSGHGQCDLSKRNIT